MNYTTQKQIRNLFWECFPVLRARALCNRTLSKGQNAQDTDTRVAWCDFVDYLARNGEISEALAALAYWPRFGAVA